MTDQEKQIRAGLKRGSSSALAVIHDMKEHGQRSPEYIRGYVLNCFAGVLGYANGALGSEATRDLLKELGEVVAAAQQAIDAMPKGTVH